MSIMELWKVNIFSIGKELYKSIMVFLNLWLILSVIPLFLLIRYLIISQILSDYSSKNTKYLVLLRILINSSILLYLIRNSLAPVEVVWNVLN